MSGSVVLLNLAGAVALLLWATRMVRTGVQRAYSAPLRRFLRRSSGNTFTAAGSGAAIAVMLQSSTAVALLLVAFAGSAIVKPATGLAIVLGADLGSAVVVQILSLDLSLVVPICLVVGTVTFMAGNNRAVRQLGRIFMGVGLILVSLGMIGVATQPLRESTLLPIIVSYLSSDPLTAFAVAALFTWLLHSSIAVVLLLMAFAEQGLVPLPLAMALVLGANLGGGLIAFALTRNNLPEARAIPVGNLILRAGWAVVGLILIRSVGSSFDWLGGTPARQVANFHLAFNVTLLLAGLPLTHRVADFSRSLLVKTAETVAQTPAALRRVSALDPALIATPRLALASAAREVLHMSETIAIMLGKIMTVYEAENKAEMVQLAELDDEVDEAHTEIKHYLADVSRQQMEPEDAARCHELISACIKLEHVGDIIAGSMLKHAQRKKSRQLVFSPEGWRELTDMHAIVVENAQLALNVLVSGDLETARQLVKSKERMRDMELKNNNRHLKRLQDGTPESIESSEVHLDTIRDLKQINSILASLAYPVLEEDGQLLQSRLM